MPGRLLGTDGQGQGAAGGGAPCSMTASSRLPVSVSTRLPPTPHEDRDALTVAREEGVSDSRPVKPGVTPLTSFHSWETRGHLKAGGPDAFQGCGTPGRWG